jgi:hypothetical protein
MDALNHSLIPRTLALATILLATWLLYMPAQGGAFLLDDMPNLGGLSSVTDYNSAAQYIFDGKAGPTGRPLALATFALQASSWNESARPFLVVNILIHLTNGVLAYLFFFQLARASGARKENVPFIALGGMALWMLMPLLATSSLMVVQRMTTLAALWMLLGLNGYLYWRNKLGQKPTTALTGMSLSLILASIFAVLCKENGALLPTLVLVTEACLLSRPGDLAPRRWAIWRAVFLIAPTVFIFLFVVSRAPYGDALVARMDFTAFERLLTEARVLWEYILKALVPRSSAFRPFHDDYAVSRSILEPVTLLAVVGWALAILSAWAARRRVPLFTFAVTWFLAAHLIESSTLPLYIYFEHRNYVAALGPVFAVAAGLFSVTGRYRAGARALFTCFVALQAVVLVSFTTTWGRPLLAAELWNAAAPRSPGAASFLVRQQLAAGHPDRAIETLDVFTTANPQHAYLRLPLLTLSCRLTPTKDHAQAVDELRTRLTKVRYALVVAAQLEQLFSAVQQTSCRGISKDDIRELAEAVYANPHFRQVSYHVSLHHQLLARMAFESGDPETALTELNKASDSWTDLDIHFKFVSVLITQGNFAEARLYLEKAEAELPGHPFRRIAGEALINDLRRYVDGAEAAALTG